MLVCCVWGGERAAGLTGHLSQTNHCCAACPFCRAVGNVHSPTACWLALLRRTYCRAALPIRIGAMITMYALAIYADWFKWLYCLFIPHNFAMWFIQVLAACLFFCKIAVKRSHAHSLLQLFNFLQHDGCEYDPKMKGRAFTPYKRRPQFLTIVLGS
eukprot:SAG31_NODE_2228_length_6146_cov_4.401191_3_plen_157_part_00